MGIAGKLLEAELILRWLARFAEADLVRCNDAITSLNESGDGGLPGGGAEILAVQQHRDAPVGPRRLYIHVGHLESLALGLEAVQRDWPGIFETLQPGAINRARIVWQGIVGRRKLRGGRCSQSGEERHNNHEGSLKMPHKRARLINSLRIPETTVPSGHRELVAEARSKCLK